ncbi:MAG: hypothetical protein HQK52_20550 [Oligoflexia bacterium]|nr:hypothetical protein [Oligoflexia bacterium]
MKKILCFCILLTMSFNAHASFISRTLHNILFLSVSMSPEYMAINSVINSLPDIVADNVETIEAKVGFDKLYTDFMAKPYPANTNKSTVTNFTAAASQLLFKYSNVLTPIAQRYYSNQQKKYLKFIFACIYYSVSGNVETGEYLVSCGLTRDELEKMRYVFKLTPDNKPSAVKVLRDGRTLEHTLPDFDPAIELLPQLL